MTNLASQGINMNEVKENNLNDKNYAIEIFNLTKRFKIRGKDKNITALDDINLKVKKGEIFGLLGPNGAGKTTMVSILTTLIQPTSGTANVLGHDILKYKRFIKENVGLMLGSEMIYYRLTGYNNLRFFSKIYDIKNSKKKIYELAESIGLTKWLNEFVENYSSGMKTRLALARVLLLETEILFLDEPMLGLDPSISREITEFLLNANKTIFLTSHQMNIIQSICDRVAFLKQGKIIMIDSQMNLKRLLQDAIKIQLKIREDQKIKLIDEFSTKDFINNIESKNDILFFNLDEKKNYSKLFGILQKYSILQIKELEPDLEDIFIKLNA